MEPCLSARRQRFLAHAENGHAGRQHEALLRAADGDIDAPFVHAEVDAGDRADTVDQKQRRVIEIVEQLAHGGDVAGDAGCGLVVANQDGLDLPRGVGGKALGVGLDRSPFAPGHVDDLDVQGMAFAEVDPEVRKLPEARGQDLVAGRKGVGDRRLPAAGARGWEDEDLSLRRLEDLLHVLVER